MKNKILMVVCYGVSIFTLVSGILSCVDFFNMNPTIFDNFFQMPLLGMLLTVLITFAFGILIPVGFLVFSYIYFQRGNSFRKLITIN